MKVGVLGLGVVGLPTVLYIAEKNLHVVGYDISSHAVEKARENGLEACLDWEEMGPCDVYIVCVSTLLTDGSPDFSALFDIARKLRSQELDSALISIESTVIPGTCKKFQRELGNLELNVVHVPLSYISHLELSNCTSDVLPKHLVFQTDDLARLRIKDILHYDLRWIDAQLIDNQFLHLVFIYHSLTPNF